MIVEAGGRQYIAVIPAHRRLDLAHFADAVGAQRARLADESEFTDLFRDCEPGAEPPFGRLYKLPVLLDAAFPASEPLVVRGGTHEETLELAYADFLRLEEPLVVSISYGTSFEDQIH